MSNNKIAAVCVYPGLIRRISITGSNRKNSEVLIVTADGMPPLSIAVTEDKKGKKRIKIIPLEEVPAEKLVRCQEGALKKYPHDRQLTVKNFQALLDGLVDRLF